MSTKSPQRSESAEVRARQAMVLIAQGVPVRQAVKQVGSSYYSLQKFKAEYRAHLALGTATRKGISLSEAARQTRTTMNTIQKYAGWAIARNPQDRRKFIVRVPPPSDYGLQRESRRVQVLRSIDAFMASQQKPFPRQLREDVVKAISDIQRRGRVDPLTLEYIGMQLDRMKISSKDFWATIAENYYVSRRR